MARKAKKAANKTAKKAAQKAPAKIASSTVFADRNGRVFHMNIKTQPKVGKMIVASKDGRVNAISISR